MAKFVSLSWLILGLMRTIISICAVVTTMLLASCNPRPTTFDNEIIVTISPLKYIVEQITGEDFQVEVLVPPGASPETFEPTPRQFIAMNEAQLLFSTGLIDFEGMLTSKVSDKSRLVNLSEGIDLMEGSCSHNHAHHTAHHDSHACDGTSCEHTHHHHGIDPHIWTSPQEVKIMARNAYNAIRAQYPDSTKYTEAFDRLIVRLDSLDNACRQMCEASAAKAFVIYHPAMTYFARAYGIEQIAVENDGKEPSVRHISSIIEQAKAKGVTTLLYQAQYPRSTIEIIAKDMGVGCTEINPLEENLVENIIAITRIITSNNAK